MIILIVLLRKSINCRRHHLIGIKTINFDRQRHRSHDFYQLLLLSLLLLLINNLINTIMTNMMKSVHTDTFIHNI